MEFAPCPGSASREDENIWPETKILPIKNDRQVASYPCIKAGDTVYKQFILCFDIHKFNCLNHATVGEYYYQIVLLFKMHDFQNQESQKYIPSPFKFKGRMLAYAFFKSPFCYSWVQEISRCFVSLNRERKMSETIISFVLCLS